MLEWTKKLIQLRRHSNSLNDGDRGHLQVTFSEENKWLRMNRGELCILTNLGKEAQHFPVGEEFRLELASLPNETALVDRVVTVPANGFVIVSAEED